MMNLNECPRVRLASDTGEIIPPGMVRGTLTVGEAWTKGARSKTDTDAKMLENFMIIRGMSFGVVGTPSRSFIAF